MRLLTLFAALITFAMTPGLAAASSRVALVVGVSEYGNIGSLENPGRDAAQVAEALRAVDFQVTELTQPQQVTRAGLVTALSRFRAQAQSADAAVVYFAGHGVEVDGANWLLPGDVFADAPDDLEGTAIRASFAVNAVRGASQLRLVILDACRNNPFARSRGWTTGQRAVGRQGLGRELDRADNVVLLLATQPGAVAADGTGSSNSPFAQALASTLTTDGMLVSELPAMVSRKMRQLTGVDQRPDQQGIFDEPRWSFRPSSASDVSGAAATTGKSSIDAKAGANAAAPALVTAPTLNVEAKSRGGGAGDPPIANASIGAAAGPASAASALITTPVTNANLEPKEGESASSGLALDNTLVGVLADDQALRSHAEALVDRAYKGEEITLTRGSPEQAAVERAIAERVARDNAEYESRKREVTEQANRHQQEYEAKIAAYKAAVAENEQKRAEVEAYNANVRACAGGDKARCPTVTETPKITQPPG